MREGLARLLRSARAQRERYKAAPEAPGVFSASTAEVTPPPAAKRWKAPRFKFDPRPVSPAPGASPMPGPPPRSLPAPASAKAPKYPGPPGDSGLPTQLLESQDAARRAMSGPSGTRALPAPQPGTRSGLAPEAPARPSARILSAAPVSFGGAGRPAAQARAARMESEGRGLRPAATPESEDDRLNAKLKWLHETRDTRLAARRPEVPPAEPAPDPSARRIPVSGGDAEARPVRVGGIPQPPPANPPKPEPKPEPEATAPAPPPAPPDPPKPASPAPDRRTQPARRPDPAEAEAKDAAEAARLFAEMEAGREVGGDISPAVERKLAALIEGRNKLKANLEAASADVVGRAYKSDPIDQLAWKPLSLERKEFRQARREKQRGAARRSSGLAQDEHGKPDAEPDGGTERD